MKKIKRYLINMVSDRLGLVITRKYQVNRRIMDHVRSLSYAVCKAEGLSIPENSHRPALLAELIGTSVSEGLFIAHHLHAALRAEGDVCEFGVAQGATSALMANEISGSGRCLWLYDSFEVCLSG